MQFKKTKATLNQLVADLSQLYALLHQTHWYMRGAGFLYLHPLLDDWMDDVNEQLDACSERLITLDGSPFSTLREFADNSKIELNPGKWDVPTNERFEKLAVAYKYIIDLFGEGIEHSQEEGDIGTEDILTGFKHETEKRYWMLRAELGKAPGLDADKGTLRSVGR